MVIAVSVLHLAFSIDLKASHGSFSTPGFPNPYPNNIKRIWNITVPVGNRIKLYFTHFNLELSYLCEYDYLQIITGGNETARFCGENGVDTEDAPGVTAIYSTDNTMTVVFRSDYSNEKRFTGFAAFFAAEDIDECAITEDGEPICDHNCYNYMGGYYCTCRKGYSLHSNKRMCTVNCSGQVFTERSGELMSPEFPSPYPKLSSCDYHIKVEEGFSIILEFEHSFDVETHPDVKCPYDVLKIKTQKKEYEPLCGTSLPSKMETGSYEVDITFKTDSSGTNTGWKIKYTTTAMPCPDPVAPPHGKISPSNTRFIFKDRFRLTCEIGYQLLQGKLELSSYEAVCKKDGTWDKPMATCSWREMENKNQKLEALVVDCTRPDSIFNGTVDFTTSTYQSVARYRCNGPFYVMKGNGDGKYTCAHDGYWRDSKGSNALPECEPSCGTPTVRTLGRIIGGQQALEKQLPWQVLLEVGGDFKGGATLLYDNWVLTAAHVLHNHGDTANVRVKMGVIHRGNSNAVLGASEKIFIHKDYKNDNINFDNDIALIKLEHRVPISEKIMPVCLPGKEDRFVVKPEEYGIVSGWGVTRASGLGRGSLSLKYVDLPVVDFETCKAAYEGKVSDNGQPLIITDNMICAGFKTGKKDACSGDSGGPFVFYDQEGSNWFLGGIVSWGLECAKAGQYGLYTKVTNYLPWIEDIISKNR
ncbi:MASP2 protease, partial [Polyodon spathula]|nr:MASP2 protease [Polyodon spathula]